MKTAKIFVYMMFLFVILFLDQINRAHYVHVQLSTWK